MGKLYGLTKQLLKTTIWIRILNITWRRHAAKTLKIFLCTFVWGHFQLQGCVKFWHCVLHWFPGWPLRSSSKECVCGMRQLSAYPVVAQVDPTAANWLTLASTQVYSHYCILSVGFFLGKGHIVKLYRRVWISPSKNLKKGRVRALLCFEIGTQI